MNIKKIKVAVTTIIASLLAHTCVSAATLDITAAPTEGTAPLPVTLSWSSTGVESCILGVENVPVTGTRSLTVTQDTNYGITCTGGKDYSDLSWAAVTTNTNGTTIPATGAGSLGGYEIKYSTNAATLQTSGTIVRVGKNVLTYRIQGQTNTTYYYTIRAYNIENVFSEYANPVNNTLNKVTVADTATVNILTFSTFDTKVYNLVKKTNGFVLVYVGNVPLNTPCDPLQYVNGYHVVPQSTSVVVAWIGTVKSGVVVGQCMEQ